MLCADIREIELPAVDKDGVFQGWLVWDKMMAAKVVPDRAPTFQEFHDEEKAHRRAVWKAEQSTAPPAPLDPSWRGWLEGKPNPVMPDDKALYAKDSKVSDDGSKLAGMVPAGSPVGSTHPTPDPELEPPQRRGSRTDRLAIIPSMDAGNTGGTSVSADWLVGCWLTVSLLRVELESRFWTKLFPVPVT